MKLGISSYSLVKYLRSGQMSLTEIIDWAAAEGHAQIEFAPIGYTFTDAPDFVAATARRVRDAGLEVSCYSIGADFMADDQAERDAEVRRMMGEIDIAAALGSRYLRHDIVSWSADPEQTSAANFDRLLPRLAESCRRTARYAAERGVGILVENHGQIMNGWERLVRLAQLVDDENFGLLTDMGNLWCVDDDPLVGVRRMLPWTKHLHCKDFYRRPIAPEPPAPSGWFTSRGGYWLRGSVFGSGDLDVATILRQVRAAGYDGYCSLEFEGMEEPEIAVRDSIASIAGHWEAAVG
ncbi:MAG: sugar phosphate isomerase/epimerase family protein [Bacillota bacterium]|nr:sugar phosphate isomerase/epimerase family protein [Bacillota bacterium]